MWCVVGCFCVLKRVDTKESVMSFSDEDSVTISKIAHGALYCAWIDREGIAFKISRNQAINVLNTLAESGYDTCRDKSCIYILFGERHTEDDDENMAYIGETDNIVQRTISHLGDKWGWKWDEIVVMCRNDNKFNKGHTLYIEEQLIRDAYRAGRYGVSNYKIREDKPSKLINGGYQKAVNDFVENVEILTGILGYKLFEALQLDEVLPIASSSAETTVTQSFPDEPLEFRMETKARGQINAKGRLVEGGGFLVYKDSSIFQEPADTMPKFVKALLQSLQDSGVIQNGRFVKDQLISSHSTAASVIRGASVSGSIAWIAKDGRTLGEVMAEIKKRNGELDVGSET
jgi:hypothetical protein